MRTRTAALGLLLAAAACWGSNPGPGEELPPLPLDGPSYVPGAEWRTAAPRQVGMDPAALDRAVDAIASGRVRDVDALVVVRHGYVVVERYFGGSRRDDVHTMQSVTKSVTALVVGAAVDAGALAVDAPILSVLPQYAALAAGDDRKRRVTVEQLLEMRSGIDFYESPYPGSPLERLNTSRGDWARAALAEPMNAEPGARWQYNSGGPIALAAAVREVTHERFDDFARTRLFAPIGVTSQFWVVSPFDSLPHAGGGLNLRAVDLARVGYLVLRGGRWGDRQLLSAAWLARALRPVTRRAISYGPYALDYGYLWYQLPVAPGAETGERDGAIWAAAGNLTQWLFVVPRHDLVVVVTGRGNGSFSEPIRLLYDDIIPAVSGAR
jgi:CubicO group peptidase (beta-lactamase class C family)